MKLLNREPTEEMIKAACAHYTHEDYTGPTSTFRAMYDAAPEVKIDMEPAAWMWENYVGNNKWSPDIGKFKPLDLPGSSAVRDSKQCRNVKALYSAEQLAAAFSEQDYEYNRKTNALIARHAEQVAALQAEISILKVAENKHKEIFDALFATKKENEQLRKANLQALKAERIKTLEEAAEYFDVHECSYVLLRMANELKEKT